MGQNILVGAWKYRSFINDPSDRVVSDLLFGEGILTFHRADLEALEGEGTFGEGYEVRLRGSCGFGSPVTLHWQAIGIGTKNPHWIYDYLAWLVPSWPHGVDQRRTLVGSVIRTAPYNEDGVLQPAGITASFIATALPRKFT